MSDRDWAAGLNQEVFEKEWKKRYPMADVIPNVEKWAKDVKPENRAIQPFNAEQIQHEVAKRDLGEGVEESDGQYIGTCDCGKQFADTDLRNVQGSLRLHKRRCKGPK